MSKRLFEVVLIAVAASAPAWAQVERSAETVLQKIREHHQGLAVWWMGNSGWLIKADNLLIGADLDLEFTSKSYPKINPPPVHPEELAGELDVLFVTHQHGDHCNVPTIKALAAGKRTTFVLPQSCFKQVTSLAIPIERIVVPEPLQAFDIKGVHVEPIHAIHGNQDFTVLTREKDFVDKIAHNCGYVFNLGGKRFLEPGDSVLTEEHIGLKNIDVLFVSPTIHNMYTDRSMILINRLQPAYVFPQHFGTYKVTDEISFWTRGYPDELKMNLSADMQKRFHQLKVGDRFDIR